MSAKHSKPREFVIGIRSAKTCVIEDPPGNEIQIVEERFTTDPSYVPWIMRTVIPTT
jgi:hypothetical protein